MKAYYLQNTIRVWEKSQENPPSDDEIIASAKEIFSNFLLPDLLIQKKLTFDQIKQAQPIKVIYIPTKMIDGALLEKINSKLETTFDLEKHILVPVPTQSSESRYFVIYKIG